MTLSAIVIVPADLDPADFTAPIAGVPALVRAVQAVRGVGLVRVVAREQVVVAATECLAAHGLDDVAVSTTAEDALGADGVVLIHDVRYPLAPAELADRVAAGLGEWDVVLPVLPMTDSVKTVAAHGVVLGNVDRSELVTVQYPRGYTVAALASDELVPADLRVGTVDGDPNAFLVDLARDRGLVEAIVTAG